MSGTDPLLRALASGDPACPDGRSLARLGELMRAQSAPPRSADLAARVAARLGEEAEAAVAVDGRSIDAFYLQDRPHPVLEALRATVRGLQPPRPVDLQEKVRARLARSGRFFSGEGAGGEVEVSRRWRVVTGVIAAHLAAALVFAVVQFRPDRPAGRPQQGGATGHWLAAPAPRLATLPERLPRSWGEIRAGEHDLFALRRYGEMRAAARHLGHMDRSAPQVEAGLAWLVSRQVESGCIGGLTGDGDRDLSCQGLAALALLGEGMGDSRRLEAARRLLAWIAAQPGLTRNEVAAGIATLALVEGALLLNDPVLRLEAERRLAGWEPVFAAAKPGGAGMGGWTMLAIAVSEQGGLRVPAALRRQAQAIARSLPPAEAEGEVGRVGLAAYGRLIHGQGGSESVARLVETITGRPPAVGADGRLDPFAWTFPTLALREVGGEAWEVWASALQAALCPAFVDDGEGCKVPAERVHLATLAGGDVFATALCVLNLQAAYRYLPVAGGATGR